MERKTDAIYEAISKFKYKEALKLCNKKDLKNSSLAAALKAHCLAKVGKKSESLELCAALLDPKKADPNDLLNPDWCNVLELTYNYMQNYEGVLTLCRVVIATLRINLSGPNANRMQAMLQDFMEKEFSANLKLGNFEAMNKTAMQMYTQFDNVKYLYWAVSANMIRYRDACGVIADNKPPVPPQVQMLTKISEKLAIKATNSELAAKDAVKPYPSCEDWKLLIDTLEAQNKYPEAISHLETTVTTSDNKNVKKINDENDVIAAQGSLVQMLPVERDEMIADFHYKNGDFSSAEGCWAGLIKNYQLGKEQWCYYEKMLESAKKVGGDFEERCRAVCEEMLKLEEGENAFKLRAPRLLLIKMAADRENDDRRQLVELITSYVKTFFKKLCCFNDLKPFLPPVVNANDARIELVNNFTTMNNESAADPTDELQLRKFIISSQLLSYLEGTIEDEKLLQNWYASLRQLKEGEQDTQRGDELMQIYCERKFNVAMDHPADSSSRVSDLIKLAALVETCVEKSPFNYHFKLIGLQVYDKLAAFQRGVGLFNGLEVKNIQLDSMSYVLLNPLLRSGLFIEASHHTSDIVGMHNQSYRQIGEHLAKGYSNGSYSQINDMLEFRKEKMANSLQLFSSKAFACCLATFQTEILGEKNGFNGLSEEDCGAQAAEGEVRGDGERALKLKTMESVWTHQGLNFRDEKSLSKKLSDNRDFGLNASFTCTQRHFNAFESSADVVNGGAILAILHHALVNALAGVEEFKAIKNNKKQKKKQTVAVLEGISDQLSLLDKYDENALGIVEGGVVLCTTTICSILVAADGESDDDAVVESLNAVSEAVEKFQGAFTRDASLSSTRPWLYNPEWLARSCSSIPIFVFFTAAFRGLGKLLKKRKKATLLGDISDKVAGMVTEMVDKFNALNEEYQGEERAEIIVAESHTYTRDRIVNILNNYAKQ